MTSADEIENLQKEISEIDRSLLAARSQSKKVEKEVLGLEELLLAERHALDLANSNLKHMRKVADHVVLSEYAQTQKAALERAENVYRVKIDLAKAVSMKTALEGAVPQLLNVRTVKLTALKKFGKVERVNFGSKNAPTE